MRNVIAILFFAKIAAAQISASDAALFRLHPWKVPAPKYSAKRAIIPAALCFISGAAWGTHEATAHHWPQIVAKYPGINAAWWDPAISWKNKYKGGDVERGRNMVPVWFTDAKHLSASITQVGLFGAGLCIAFGERRPWWHYGIDLLISGAAYSAGNRLTYNLIF